MARKKKSNAKKELVEKIDSYVDEIEKTHNYQVFSEDMVELDVTSSLNLDDKKKKKKSKPKSSKKEETKKEEPKKEEVKVEDKEEKDIKVEDKEPKEEKKEEDSKKKTKKDDDSLNDIDQKIIEEFDNKKEEESKKIEELNETNGYDFDFDDDRLAETGSLDTSFLEGRINANPEKAKKAVLKKGDKELNKEEKVKEDKEFDFKLPKIFFIILLMIFVAIISSVICYKFAVKEKIVEKTKIEVKEVKVVDDNYLFLGDSLTDYYDLDKFYEGLPVVNSGYSGNTTDDILRDMNNRVYRYNPSKIFLLIGTNDFINDKDGDYVVEQIEKIIKEIKENRPVAKIYVESIYPVNNTDDEKVDEKIVRDRDNDTIKETNKNIEELCKKYDLTYIDMYPLLIDDDDNLKIEYTEEGLHLNDEGYEVVTKELMKYIEE